MPIVSAPQDFNEDELYVDLLSIFGESLFLKCEGFNFAGSIKVKAATEMVEAAERDGRLHPGSILVGRQRELVRTWPALTEVTVKGSHFVPEDSPHEIGRALAEWIPTI